MNALSAYLRNCAEAFDKTPGYPVADRILTRVFGNYPMNDSLEAVLHKVALLNALYRTQILDVYGMADHVLGQGLDPYLRKGRPEAVHLLRQGHRVGSKNGKERDFYSFATKYCHWHRPDVYPMYDHFVSVALRWLNERLNFLPRFSADELRDYPLFLRAVDTCCASLRLRWAGYKRLDQGLWILGQIVDGKADGAVVRAVGEPPKGI